MSGAISSAVIILVQNCNTSDEGKRQALAKLDDTQNPRAPWSRAGALLLIVSVVGMLAPLPGRTLFWSAAQNSSHCLLFAVLCLLCLHLKQPTHSKKASYIQTLFIVVSLLFFGVAMEMVQSALGRSASLADIALDAAGILVGLLIHAGLRGYVRWRIPLYLGALLVFLVCFLPPIRYAIARFYLPALPQLVEFDSPFAIERIIASNSALVALSPPPDNWPSASDTVLKVDLGPGIYPGVLFLEPPGNWSDYDSLKIEIFNPGSTTVNLAVRLDDSHTNEAGQQRFTRFTMIEPGAHSISIPLSEEITNSSDYPDAPTLDLEKINEILLFLSLSSQSTTLYVDDIRLSAERNKNTN